MGGIGGGGAQSDELPPNRMLAPSGVPVPLYEMQKRESMKPSADAKKKATPRAACASVSASKSVGSSAAVPGIVDVNVPAMRSTAICEAMSLPDAGRSGVLKYS